MKTKLTTMLLGAIIVTLLAVPAFAAGVQVVGKVTDEQGKPVADAQVVFLNDESGTKVEMKTNKNGDYQRIGVPPAIYKAMIIRNGQTLLTMAGIKVDFAQDINTINFDLAKIRQAQTQGQGMTPEQKKEMEESEKKIAEAKKRNEVIKGLNAKLVQADQLERAGDASTDPAVKAQSYGQAVKLLEEVTAADQTHDLIFANLAQAYILLGDFAGKTNKEEASADYAKAIAAYRKAIEVNPAAKDIGGYHNNLGQALAKSGKPQEAVAEYTAAATAAPTQAAQFYFNAGATLVNVSLKETVQDTRAKDLSSANEMFDKAIAANPNFAEAYFQKGVNLLNQAKYDPSGKVIPVAGTAEAFQKYLEIAPPDSKNIETAKANIEFLGGKVETGYRAGKKK